MNPEYQVKQLYNNFGQRKVMGVSSDDVKHPHFFLHRNFLGENDLLVILNTKRCAYQCLFCQLPAKSSKKLIKSDDILSQFLYVMDELKHSLSVLDRVTFSNEGSVLDSNTLPTEALLAMAKCVHELRRVHTWVLETRLEFINAEVIHKLRKNAPRAAINILTGFETLDINIRDNILFKRESIQSFETGLDIISRLKLDLTCYILYKPSQTMNDDDAFIEANESIDYLYEQTRKRKIPLSIRLNPMYAAEGSHWTNIAKQTPSYSPPKLTDILKLAESKRHLEIPIYIGLSTEGLDNGNNYSVREDYSHDVVKQIILFNNSQRRYTYS